MAADPGKSSRTEHESMSEHPLQQQQQRHQRSDAVGCAGQQSFYCSRAVEETLASCFGTASNGAPGGCGQMSAGPVDVEDLANFCNFASQPQANVFAASNCCDFLPPQQQPVQQVQVPEVPFYHPMNLEEAAFNYCTDNRWMACPATSYCPLYDVSQQPLESWQVLPCAQDFRGYYVADDELLEEYMCV